MLSIFLSANVRSQSRKRGMEAPPSACFVGASSDGIHSRPDGTGHRIRTAILMVVARFSVKIEGAPLIAAMTSLNGAGLPTLGAGAHWGSPPPPDWDLTSLRQDMPTQRRRWGYMPE